jgi:hypothetical protein
MGLLDIFFPAEARARKAKDFRKKLKQQQTDREVAYKTRQENFQSTVTAKSLEKSLLELYDADQKTPIVSRTYDLESYRSEVLQDLVDNYKRGNLEVIADAVNKMGQGDFFARSFLYTRAPTRREKYEGAFDPADRIQVEVEKHSATFDPRDLLKSAKELVDLAKKAYHGAETQRVMGAGKPTDPKKYEANLQLGGKVYDLLSRTAQYLVQSRRGYEALSQEHKAALSELNELLTQIKPERAVKPWGVASLVALFGGAFFFSTKVTGNVVGVSTQTSSLIGVGLLIIAIIAGIFWIKSRKPSKKTVSKKVIKKRK